MFPVGVKPSPGPWLPVNNARVPEEKPPPIQASEITARLIQALKGKSSAAVGRAVGRERNAVHQWRSGRKSHPDLTTFANLCRAMGWSADDVLGITPRPMPTPEQLEEATRLLDAARALLSPEVDVSRQPTEEEDESRREYERLERARRAVAEKGSTRAKGGGSKR